MPYDDARRSVIHHVRWSHVLFIPFVAREETVALLLCVVYVRESRSGRVSPPIRRQGVLFLFTPLFLSLPPFFFLPCVCFFPSLYYIFFFRVGINDDTVEEARVRSIRGIRIRIFDRVSSDHLSPFLLHSLSPSLLPSTRQTARRACFIKGMYRY